MKYKINVTKNDIKKGVRRSNTHCPISKAVFRTLKAKNCVSVTPIFVRVDYADKVFVLPEAAKRFIKKFDNGKEVEPFSFDLNVEEVDECLIN